MSVDTNRSIKPVLNCDEAGNVVGVYSAPSSVLARPANTTAYAGSAATPQLIGSTTVAGSLQVPSFGILNAAGLAAIARMMLSTNVTTGWGGVSVVLTLSTVAPTFTNGDGGTYAVATGAAGRRAQYAGTFTQYGDGAVAELSPLVGSAPVLKPAAGGVIYWDLQIQSAATPISGQTFTLTPEVWN